MKKTNVTSIQPSSWIPSVVGQCMQWVLAGLLLFVGTTVSLAQSSPNCTNINASIDANGYAVVEVGEFVTNCAAAEPLNYVVYNQFGGVVQTGTAVACDDEIRIPACNAIGRTYKVHFSNAAGSCWSDLTFKQGNGPTVVGNKYYLWCLDPEVSDIGLYLDRFYGNDDDKYEPAIDRKYGYVPCRDSVEARHVTDWIDAFPCIPGEDFAKIIYREFEAFDKDGRRGTAFDTICVYRLPEIVENIYCPEKDTVYCGDFTNVGPYWLVPRLDSVTGEQVGTDCDTIYLLTAGASSKCPNFKTIAFDPKCGVDMLVSCWEFPNICSPQYKVTLSIKQTCWSEAFDGDCVADGDGPVEVAPGYYECTFWIIDLDTLPPYAEPKYDKINEHNLVKYGDHCYDTPVFPGATLGVHYAPIILVPTTSHDCAAHTYIPPICAYDNWSGIKQVKARIEGVGSWVATAGAVCDFVHKNPPVLRSSKNGKGTCYEFHQPVKLPKSEYPYTVMYEVIDNCHQIDTIYGYLLVKDQTRPVAVADKGVTVSLSGKKVWVYADTFDEGSWDNCDLNLILARRTDWYEACIDLCKDPKIEWCATGGHKDTLWTAYLSDDKHVDEVEAHYAKFLKWMWEDGTPCGELIYNAWQYDLMKYATLYCKPHPYPVDNKYFRGIFEGAYYDYLNRWGCDRSPNAPPAPLTATAPAGVGGSSWTHRDLDPGPGVKYCFDDWKCITGKDFCPSGYSDFELNEKEFKKLVDLYEQIGGGWSEAVAFDCEDACGPVTVELLVMDYWCNWSKAWTKVWVEDKTPVTVKKDVVDAEISCYTYRSNRYSYPGQAHPVSLEWIIDRSKTGEQAAYDALDDILGGYCKAWVDPYGNFVDEKGVEIDCDIIYSDSVCVCTTIYDKVLKYDEHFGYIWVEEATDSCYYKKVDLKLQKGIVAVNCAENVQCAQDVWCEFDHCGQGYIFRKFKIWQGCPAGSEAHSPHRVDTIYRHQRIWVGNECRLNKKMFELPYDEVTIYDCGITSDPDGSGNVGGLASPEYTGYPVYTFDDDCRIVGIGYEDQVFKIVGGNEGCYKIIRTWYFADWCPSKGDEFLGEGTGKWWINRGYQDYCIQKILIIDTVPPECIITGPVENGGVISAAGCEYDFHATVDVEDACGVIAYYWELINDETKAVVKAGSGSLNRDVADDFGVHVAGLLSGDYTLKARVTDECQNESYCKYDFTLETGKKPTPVCITSLTVDLTPWDSNGDGVADSAHAKLWANEFDRSSQAPCGVDDSALEFYIELGGSDSPAGLTSELIVTCENLGTQMVRVWVKSPTGSYDFCDVLLVVQDNNGACGDISSAVRGVVLTELDTEVEKVEIRAQLQNGTLLNGVTDVLGAYRVATSVVGQKVIVTPVKNTEPDNGVSTLDLVKIQRHILGKEMLESRFREVAADVNNDGRISALDLLEIRRLILGKVDGFENVNSWKFFSKVDNKEVYTIDNIQGIMQLDWTGVKMGDVDLSNDPSRSAGRSGKSLVFNVDNAQMIAGNQYRVDFRANNFEDITGYQFTINLDRNAVKVLNVEGGALELTADNFGLSKMDQGLVTTSWNGADGMSIDRDEVVFSLIVEAVNSVSLSDVVAVNSRVTSAEAYNSADQVHDVALNFVQGGAVQTGFALYQNEPNPFRETTLIGFNLPEAMSATITVYDVTGKVLKIVEGDYAKGYNNVNLTRSDFKVNGVLYYQLDTEAFTATKKMIVIE